MSQTAKKTSRITQIVHASEGFTLVESVVSLALLLAVLVPSGLLLTRLVMKKQANRQTMALGYASRYMEETIMTRDYVSEEKIDEGWIVVRSIEKTERLVRIEISVAKDTERLISLCTYRLEPY